jgi:TonB-dependent receptor
MIVGGVRFQDYRSHAEAGEVDNLGQYVQDEGGNLVVDPLTGTPIKITGGALEITERTNIERGVVTDGTVEGFFPSFNAIYRLSESIQLRFGYADSVSYPDLGDLAAVTTVSDITASIPRLTVNSPLKPWYGKNYDFDIEYYTRTGGSFTLAFFRKEISDFVNQIRHEAATAQAGEALERYGYGALVPLNYVVVEKFNGGEASFDGWEFAMRQSLDRYLPLWGRGLTLFYNTSYTSAPRGVSAGNISAASQRLMNWGAAFRRGRLSASLSWNHKPEPKRRTPSTTHGISYTLLDLDVSYQFRPAITFFASASNLTSVPMGSRYIYSEATPDYARRRNFDVYGIQCILGLKGQF